MDSVVRDTGVVVFTRTLNATNDDIATTRHSDRICRVVASVVVCRVLASKELDGRALTSAP
jgi:hypothetical protein